MCQMGELVEDMQAEQLHLYGFVTAQFCLISCVMRLWLFVYLHVLVAELFMIFTWL